MLVIITLVIIENACHYYFVIITFVIVENIRIVGLFIMWAIVV